MVRKLSGLSSHFMSPKMIGSMDVFISLTASVLTVLFAGMATMSPNMNWIFLAHYSVLSIAATVVAMMIFRLPYRVIRHMSSWDILAVALCSIAKEAILAVLIVLTNVLFDLFASLGETLRLCIGDFVITLFLFGLVRLTMILIYQILMNKLNEDRNFSNVLVYGLGDDSVSLIKNLATSRKYKLVGFVTSNLSGQGMRLESYPVYCASNKEELKGLKDALGVSCIIFPKSSYVREESDRLVKMSYDCGIKLLMLSVLDENENEKLQKSVIRDIKIEDILGRPEIHISKSKIASYVFGKTILVTGAGGSIGSELCRQLAKFGVGRLIMFDNAETPLHNLRLEFLDRHSDIEVVPVIGDVRTLDRVDFTFCKYRPQIVFHAAAYKHVPLMEENPCEAVRVNLGGTKNVTDCCLKYGAEAMVMISTDKAVNPTNVMGCSKRLAEIYVQSRGLDCENGCDVCHTRFVTTRFGNVLGSNGSVVPRFRQQIEEGGPVTVTHPDINRFFMTIPEACQLVLEAASMSSGNNIFVFDMGEPVKIVDLARNMIKLAGMEPDKDIKIVYTGLRPGEKLYEEVLSAEENSVSSFHERIRIAKVRTDYDYKEMIPSFEKLIQLSCEVKIEQMIRLMKEIVPEYVSNNSEFERFDKIRTQA